jgi:hypothetical protein
VLYVSAKAAGVENVGVHTLRHSAAVAWLEAGVHIKAVADLLGHSSIAITGDIYGHTSDDTARAAVDGLSQALVSESEQNGAHGKEPQHGSSKVSELELVSEAKRVARRL